jgi:hypothetical protein
MRILVTGVRNPTGAAIAKGLAASGHTVRAFGLPPGTNPFADDARIEPFAGEPGLQGSLEPVAAECQAIVHAAALDEDATATTVETGARYARFAAERELVDQFVLVLPPNAPRSLASAVEKAETLAKAARVPHTILAAETPEAASDQVQRILAAVEAAP